MLISPGRTPHHDTGRNRPPAPTRQPGPPAPSQPPPAARLKPLHQPPRGVCVCAQCKAARELLPLHVALHKIGLWRADFRPKNGDVLLIRKGRTPNARIISLVGTVAPAGRGGMPCERFRRRHGKMLRLSVPAFIHFKSPHFRFSQPGFSGSGFVVLGGGASLRGSCRGVGGRDWGVGRGREKIAGRRSFMGWAGGWYFAPGAWGRLGTS